jgi:thioredoxin-related protein
MKMDAVTYPNEAIVETLNEQFVCVKLNQKRAGADVVEAMRPAKLMWTPSFIFQDHRGIEVRRSVGFLPPDEFKAELLCVLGLIELQQARNQTAFERLEQVKETLPNTNVAPEAIFWAGVALFRQHGGDKEVLRDYWQNLNQQYPSSTWWTRVDVFDVLDQ